MKKNRIFISLLLAAAITAGGGLQSMADEAAVRTITVTNEKGASQGHVYEAYRIFRGDYTETVAPEAGDTVKILTNIDWDPDFDSAGLVALMQRDSVFASKMPADESGQPGEATAEDVAAILSGLTSEEVMAFARLAEQFLPDTDDGHAVLDQGETETEISVTGDGYYLVKDREENLEGAELDAATFFLLTVAGDAQVRTKSDWPSITKKIVDKGDSHGEGEEALVDTNEAAVGDRVTYEIKSTIPSMTGYESYVYRIYDTLSEGLTFDEDSVRVYLDRDGDYLTTGGNPGEGESGSGQREITAEAEVVTEGLSDGYSFMLDFQDFISHAEDAGQYIILRFDAVVNDNAVVGEDGNPNTVHLEYSNYPGKDSLGRTPEDTVVTYVTGLDILKLDAKDSRALEGAEFVLYMVDEAGQKEAGRINRVKDGEEEYFEFSFTDNGDGTYETHRFTTGEDGKIHIRGLRAGEYLLEEVTPPEGYNSLTSPVSVAISWEGAEEVDDGTEKAVWKYSISGEGVETAENQQAEEGIISLRILNNKGLTLPGTGGRGVYLLYSGGILMMLALLYRVNRKKRSGTRAEE